jgi:hypothetical protein
LRDGLTGLREVDGSEGLWGMSVSRCTILISSGGEPSTRGLVVTCNRACKTCTSAGLEEGSGSVGDIGDEAICVESHWRWSPEEEGGENVIIFGERPQPRFPLHAYSPSVGLQRLPISPAYKF